MSTQEPKMAARVARYQEKSERARDQANFERDNCFIAQTEFALVDI